MPGIGSAVESVLHSFTGGISVLMADGTAKPIDQVEPGDTVIDSESGRSGTQTHAVQRVIVTHPDCTITGAAATSRRRDARRTA